MTTSDLPNNKHTILAPRAEHGPGRVTPDYCYSIMPFRRSGGFFRIALFP